MPESLTPDQRIALIEQIEKGETSRRRRAVWITWASVAFAASILALIVFSARRELVRIQAELTDAESMRAGVEADIKKLTETKLAVEKQLIASQGALSGSLGALGRVNQEARRDAVEKQLAADPNTAQLLPRVYIQIVDPADRAWATEVGRKLESAGMIALGVEYVPKTVGLKTTDVRYYKKSEESGAARIVAILKNAGVSARLNYLNMENNTNVRPNHFEVWFAAGARNHPVT